MKESESEFKNRRVGVGVGAFVYRHHSPEYNYYNTILVVKGPAVDATDVLQPWGLLCNPVMMMKMMIIFFVLFLVM
jgi:hypothetical protein